MMQGLWGVSAVFTGRLWPPAQRRPVKHTETEEAPRVEARDPASSKTIKAEPANVLALPKTNKADQQVAFSCFQDAVAEAIAEGAHKNQKSGLQILGPRKQAESVLKFCVQGEI